MYTSLSSNLNFFPMLMTLAAGRNTTSEELEDMLEQGNPAVFTQGVKISFLSTDHSVNLEWLQVFGESGE